jgi:thiol-disulfide isomerase/thioredoxin
MQVALKLFLAVLFVSIAGTVYCQDAENEIAPDFSGKTPDGKVVKLSDYKGKVVLVDFWASWCSPCREEMPELIKFYKSHGNTDFEILAVNIDKDNVNVNHFLDKLITKPLFPVILDNEQKIPELFNIESMPTTIFIDKSGKIRYRHNGFKLSYIEDFKTELTQLIKEK